MRATILNRLSLFVAIGALLTVMTGSVSIAATPTVSTSSFSYAGMDGNSCPYSAGHSSASAELSQLPVTQ